MNDLLVETRDKPTLYAPLGSLEQKVHQRNSTLLVRKVLWPEAGEDPNRLNRFHRNCGASEVDGERLAEEIYETERRASESEACG